MVLKSALHALPERPVRDDVDQGCAQQQHLASENSTLHENADEYLMIQNRHPSTAENAPKGENAMRQGVARP